MSKRSKRRAEKRLKALKAEQKVQKHVEQPEVRKADKRGFCQRIYEDKYRLLLVIPMVLLFLAIVQIAVQTATTGDFIIKDVSLKGGVTITIPAEQEFRLEAVQDRLRDAFPGNDFSTRILSSLGKTVGLVIEADISHEQRDSFISEVSNIVGMDREDFSIEEIGSSLGASFFRQTMIALLIAFLFMGVVVFLYFKTFVPSIAVILAAFSDIVVTLAIVNVLGIKISTAGIAAFLMLIGYSVDTDILLSTRVIKRKEGSIMERIYSALRTGLTMNMTTLAAVTIGMFMAKSDVLVQIMTIIFIGLLVDMINTWIQNVGILRMYMERKNVED